MLARWLGHKVHADMDVIVDQQFTVEEAVQTGERGNACTE
jgi:divalent metal cation (Fe/Co/Zn/Cd) transporter